MTSIFTFIQTVFLDRMSLAAQLIWLEAFRQMLKQKQQEVTARYQFEQVAEKLADGEIQNPDEYTEAEISQAIEMIRNDKQRLREYQGFDNRWRPHQS